MTDHAKKPERLIDQVPPSWAGGSRTTKSRDRIRELNRRRAKIAKLMLARRSQ